MWWCAANGGMRRRCHHLIGDPVRFLFVDIPRLVNLEFGLQTQSLLFAALAAFPTCRKIPARALALQYPGLWLTRNGTEGAGGLPGPLRI